jgi:hypothetical protein
VAPVVVPAAVQEGRPVVRLRERALLAAVLATALERLPTKLARAERRQEIRQELASAIIRGSELILPASFKPEDR